MFSAVAGFDAVFVGSGVNSLTGAALLSRAGWKVCVLERNEVLGGAIRTSDDLTAPGFTHELMASWHPLFAGSAAYAELGDDLGRPRARVPQHRPADRDALPGRRRGLPDDLARGQRRRVRAPRRGRRRRLEPPVRAVHGLRRAQLRRALRRTVVRAGTQPRAQGLPQLRAPRPGRVRGQLADQRARLARDDVRVGARARPARAVGAAHRARPRAGGGGLHDAGHRLRRATRRHARPEGRRRAARRGARGDRARERRRAAHGRGRRARAARGRARERRAPDRRRDDRGLPRRDRERHPDAALRAARARGGGAGDGLGVGPGLPLRARRHADPPRAGRAAAVDVERGRAARAHGDGARYAPVSTASRARSTRPSAGSCRPRRRSSSASPAPSIRAAPRRASR